MLQKLPDNADYNAPTRAIMLLVWNKMEERLHIVKLLGKDAYSQSSQSADRTVSAFVDSSAQHRGNEAEPDSNGNKNFQSGPNVPCQSAQTEKSVSSA